MTYWTTQHFKAMQKAWYQRLKDSGFEDVERLVGHEMELRQCAEHVFGDNSATDVEEKIDYQSFLTDMIRQTKFKREVDRLILVFHARGMAASQISRELERLGQRRNRDTVRYRIRIFEMKWGIRKYTPKQLNHCKVS